MDACAVCFFFRPNPNARDVGLCRRRSPKPGMAEEAAWWPRVEAKDWCGEFVAVERKNSVEERKAETLRELAQVVLDYKKALANRL